MIIIADSGSTKTQWKLISENGMSREIISEGINPYFQTAEQITLSLRLALDEFTKETQVRQVYFYGAGCGSLANREILQKAFTHVYPGVLAEINTDLLGAARAVCGSEPGIAAILGTGANSCDYDGFMIKANMPSLGYVLGDEGSGAYIGKMFMQDLLNKELPGEVDELFHEQYDLSRDQIIQAVYKEANPNRFLASFVKFLFTLRDTDYVHALFVLAFEAFFRKHISKYENFQTKPLCCVGSVAFYFKEILAEVCKKNEMVLKKVIKKPLQGISDFHTTNTRIS